MPINKKAELIVKARTPRASAPGIEKRFSLFSHSLLSDLSSLHINLIPIAQPRSIELAPLMDGLLGMTSEIHNFFKVEAPEEMYPTLLQRLIEREEIEAAYIKPPTEPAVFRLNGMSPSFATPPLAVTPSLRSRQQYLDASPVGINVQHAWNINGGKGNNVNIIDIEWGWRFTHDDLKTNQGGVIAGPNSTDDDHGTAVIGEFSGDDNNFGIVGISPNANVSAVSLAGTLSTSQAIYTAANKLQAGDIILLEVHRGGPQAQLGNGQFGFIGIEWWPDDFAAIQYAVDKGIIVVQAAGNGGQDLDNPVYDVRPVNNPYLGTFPPNWRNPFNPANPQSGAVFVGAGMPPPGTHGRNFHPDFGDAYLDRGRCFFSNYGGRVDVQGWGWEVTTTGYGDLQGGTNKDSWYTDQFSGTSSASPIIVGVLACLQGITKARGNQLLTSHDAIHLLRNTGSPQQNAPGFNFIPNMLGSGYPQQYPARPSTQRIGTRPDLQQLIAQLPIGV